MASGFKIVLKYINMYKLSKKCVELCWQYIFIYFIYLFKNFKKPQNVLKMHQNLKLPKYSQTGLVGGQNSKKAGNPSQLKQTDKQTNV